MTIRLQPTLAGCAALILLASGNTLSAQSPAATAPTTNFAAAELPFDTMARLYRPLLAGAHQDLGWGLKLESISRNELKFSTGTRELFYTWAKTACADWLADPGAFVICHGDVHLGNLGTYVVSHPGTELAIGLKDFDESCSMPFQTDLLQAALSLRLTAEREGVPLSPEQADRAVDELLAAYRSTLRSGQTATEALKADPHFEKLLAHTDGTLLGVTHTFFDGDHFRPELKSEAGHVTDILFPALIGADAAAPFDRETLGAVLSQATKDSPLLSRILLPRNGPEFENVIADAAIRYRLGSGGSQGLMKLVVRLNGAVRTLSGSTDAVVYFKEQTTSAAMRGGYVPTTDAPGGERNFNAALALCSPQPGGIGAVTAHIGAPATGGVGGDARERSFAVSIYSPWEGSPAVRLDSEENILWAARTFGTILAAAHRNATGNDAALLRARITPALKTQLLDRSAEYQHINAAAFKALVADPRLKPLIDATKHEIETHGK